MNQSTNVADGALQFHLKVSKGEDGRTTVSCPSQPQVPPVTADQTSTAINQMRQRLQSAAGKGKVKGV